MNKRRMPSIVTSIMVVVFISLTGFTKAVQTQIELPITTSTQIATDSTDEWIAYIGLDYNVWIIHPDNNENTQITFDGNQNYRYENLKWSPDGTKLGFNRFHYDTRSEVDIYVFDPGKNQTKLAVSHDQTDGGFDWYHGSDYILYESPAIPISKKYPSGVECIVGYEDYRGIYSLNLSTEESKPFLDLNNQLPIRNIKVSPSSENLIFKFITLDYQNENNQNLINIQNPTSFEKLETVQNDCTWSPDGTKIACGTWESTDVNNPEYRSLSIFSKNGEFDSITPTEAGAYDSKPFWAPSGTEIAFNVSNYPYGYGDSPCGGGRFPPSLEGGIVQETYVEVLSLQTNERRFISNGKLNGWSPDGERLLISSYENVETSSAQDPSIITVVETKFYIHIVDKKSLKKTFLVNGTEPTWQPKGQLNVPGSNISEWIKRKTVLIRQLDFMDIPTSIFTIPYIDAYDERSSQDLLSYVKTVSDAGTLTQDEENVFIRLVLEEEILSKILPAYTSINAYQSETFVDVMKVAMSFNRTTKLLTDACNGKTNLLCYMTMKKVNEALNRLISKDLAQLCSKLMPSLLDEKTINGACQLAVAKITDQLEGGKSPLEIIKDNAIQLGLTITLIQPYLDHSQDWLEKGVRTADLRVVTADYWNITGSYGQAQFKTDDLAGKAELHRSIAEDRYKSFQKGADIMSIATDLADIASLSPYRAIAKLIATLTRFTQVGLDVYVLGKNGDEITCIESLSKQATEIAFNADLVQADCTISYINNQNKTTGYSTISAKINSSNRIPVVLENAGAEYIRSLDELIVAVQAEDHNTIQNSAESFFTASDNLDQILNQEKAILQAKGSLEENRASLMGMITKFDIQNINIFLSVAEYSLIADNETPESDLVALAGEAKASLAKIELSSGQLDLQPPADKPVLVIENIVSKLQSNNRLTVTASIKNIGVVEGQNLRVQLDNGSEQSEEISAGALNSGKSTNVELSMIVTKSYFFINIWNDDMVFISDYNQVNTETTTNIDWRWWLGGGILLTICLGAFLLLIIVFFVHKRKQNS